MSTAVQTSILRNNNKVSPQSNQCGKDGDVDELKIKPMEDLSDLFRLEVGGEKMAINSHALKRFPDTPLYKIATKRIVPSELSSIVLLHKNITYIDCDPIIFQAILESYRIGHFHPPNACPTRIKMEMERWGIKSDDLASCCSSSYLTTAGDIDSLNKIVDVMNNYRGDPLPDDASRAAKNKRALWTFLEFPHSSKGAMVYQILSYIFTIVSVMNQLLWSFDLFEGEVVKDESTSFQNVSGNAGNGSFQLQPRVDRRMGQSEAGDILHWVDTTVTFIIMLEILLRIVVTPNKKFHFSLFLTWMDILGCVPVTVVHIIEIVTTHEQQKTDPLKTVLMVLYLFAICRVFRLLNLSRIFPGLRVLIIALYVSSAELALLFLFVSVFVFIFGVIIYNCELNDPNTQFDTVARGFWWALITMTTVGYGDVYPVTVQGMIAASFCAFCGMIIIVMPIPIIAGNFYLLYNYFKERWHLMT